MVGRALLRRCPRCGGRGAWFTGWFARTDRCRTCGYRYERQAGFSLGAVTANTIVTFGLLFLTGLVGVIVTYPDLPVVPLTGACLAVGAIVPIAFYPFSYTLWAAVDLRMQPLDAAAVADADAHRPGRSGDA